MSWKKTIKDESKGGSWKDTIADEDPSELQAGVRGLGQGASLGFWDEIAGAGEALGQSVGIKGLGSSDFSDIGFTQPLALDESRDFSQAYTEGRDQWRGEDKAAREANPYSYGAGEIGGSVATAFVPGLNVAKGASLAGRVGQAAALGGAAGLGLSEEESLSGMVKDTAIGAGLGAGLQGVGEKVLSPIASKIGSGIKKSAEYLDDKLPQWVGRIAANVPEEYTELYLKNPKAVNEAMSREELAGSLLHEVPDVSVGKTVRGNSVKGMIDPDSSIATRTRLAKGESEGAMQLLKQKLSEIDSIAWDLLDEHQVIKKTDLIDDIHAIVKKEIINPKDNLSRTGGAGGSLRKLNAIQSELDAIMNAYPENISQADIKAIVQDLQKIAYADAGSPRSSVGAEGVRQLSGSFNDHLRGENPLYDIAMEPVRNNTKLLGDLERNFINRQDPTSYDTFFKKLKTWRSKDESASAKRALRELDRVTGSTVTQDIQNTLAKEAFTKGNTNGSRNTLFGTVVGGVGGTVVGGPLGGLLGVTAGSTAGQTADKYAGAAFKALLDGKIAAEQVMEIIGPRLGKYAKPLMDAATRGQGSLASTHFILSQTDPGYREAIKALKDEEE